jgi:hypothetical protein
MKDYTVYHLARSLDCFYDFHTTMTKPIVVVMELMDETVDSEILEIRQLINIQIHDSLNQQD